jgi:hypothetical protein
MRTTITLTPEAEALVRSVMKERKIGFTEAVNQAIVSGLSTSVVKFSTPSFNMGRAKVPVDKALNLAGSFEDQELLRKRTLGK